MLREAVQENGGRVELALKVVDSRPDQQLQCRITSGDPDNRKLGEVVTTRPDYIVAGEVGSCL